MAHLTGLEPTTTSAFTVTGGKPAHLTNFATDGNITYAAPTTGQVFKSRHTNITTFKSRQFVREPPHKTSPYENKEFLFSCLD